MANAHCSVFSRIPHLSDDVLFRKNLLVVFNRKSDVNPALFTQNRTFDQTWIFRHQSNRPVRIILGCLTVGIVKFAPCRTTFVEQGFQRNLFQPLADNCLAWGVFLKIGKFVHNIIFSQPVACLFNSVAICDSV